MRGLGLLIAFCFFILISISNADVYQFGIMDISHSIAFDKEKIQQVCIQYPTKYFKYPQAAEKTYTLLNTSTPAICNKNATQKSQVKLKNSLLLVSANEDCNIKSFISSLEGKYEGVIVFPDLSMEGDPSNMSLEVFGYISNKNSIKIANLSNESNQVYVKIYSPEETVFEPSVLLLWLIAFSCIIIGPLISNIKSPHLHLPTSSPTDGSQEFSQSSNKQQDLHINAYLIIFAGCSITTTLVLLYYFYNYLVYFFMLMFGIATAKALYDLSTDLFSSLFFKMDNKFTFKILACGIHRIIWMLVCLTPSIIWFIFRFHSFAWILQDILGYIFCLHMIRTFRVPTLRLCSYLLWFLFIYDIFFVFITPFFTKNGKSIMVEVATGGIGGDGGNETSGSYDGRREVLPLLFKLPHLSNDIYDICTGTESFTGYSLLGFGDIVIPGLLVCFTYSIDLILVEIKHPYFITSVIGYGLGLVCAFIVLFLSQTGQPALLYIVPTTLIPIYIVALYKKQFKSLWTGGVPE